MENIDWAYQFMPLIQMARGFDLAWLKTHEPTKETEKVAKWVLDISIRYIRTTKARATDKKMPWLGDATAPKR